MTQRMKLHLILWMQIYPPSITTAIFTPVPGVQHYCRPLTLRYAISSFSQGCLSQVWICCNRMKCSLLSCLSMICPCIGTGFPLKTWRDQGMQKPQAAPFRVSCPSYRENGQTARHLTHPTANQVSLNTHNKPHPRSYRQCYCFPWFWAGDWALRHCPTSSHPHPKGRRHHGGVCYPAKMAQQLWMSCQPNCLTCRITPPCCHGWFQGVVGH